MRTRQVRQASLLPGVTQEALSSFPVDAVGVDEVGRGCLAGPVVACALVLPEHFDLPGLADSKKLSPKKREELAPLIQEQALGFGLGMVDAPRIDEINILQATFEAMAWALLELDLALAGSEGKDTRCAPRHLPGLVLVDGNRTIPEETLQRVFAPGQDSGTPWRAPFGQRCVVGGDARVAAISAASIVAKTFRDTLMNDMDRSWPGYGFAHHKGYGTKEHLLALERLGPCPLHRHSFTPVARH